MDTSRFGRETKLDKKRKGVLAITAFMLIVASTFIKINLHSETVKAALAPAGTTPSNVTCTTPGDRGAGSCNVDVSTINSAFSGFMTFVLGDSGEMDNSDGGSPLPTWSINPSGAEANAVSSNDGISGSGTLAVPNSILIDGVGSPIPVTQMRTGNAASYISGSVTLIIPNSIIFVGEGNGNSPNTDVLFEDGGTAPLTVWAGGFGFESTSLTSIEFPGRLTRFGQVTSWTAHLTDVTFNEGDFPLTISQGGFGTVPGMTGTVTFPSNTILITGNAFSGTGITGVSFNDGGTNPLVISGGAFSCANLAGTITFPSNLATIDADTFQVQPGASCSAGHDNENLTNIVFTNPDLSGVSDEAFRAGTSFANSCSAGSTETAIIEFLGTDDTTPIFTTNDFGCGAYTNGPDASTGIDPTTGVGISGSLIGWRVSGWHLQQNLSDPAITFPWIPFSGAVAVNDLPVYGAWTELSGVSVSLPSGFAFVGDTIAVTVYGVYADGTQADVTNYISSLTSVDIATGASDTVVGNQVTFVQASTHEICATFQGETGCSTIEVSIGAPDTGIMGWIRRGGTARAIGAIWISITVGMTASAATFIVGRRLIKRIENKIN